MRNVVTCRTLLLILAVFFAFPPPGANAADDPKSTAVTLVEENAGFVGDLGRQIWEFSEIGLQEFQSSDLLVETLEEAGFAVERGQAGMPTAFVGTFSKGTGKPVIGIKDSPLTGPGGTVAGGDLV